MLTVCSCFFKVPAVNYWKEGQREVMVYTSVSKHLRSGWLEGSIRLHPQPHLLKQSCSEGLVGFMCLHCCLKGRWHVFHSMCLNTELSYFSRERMQKLVQVEG